MSVNLEFQQVNEWKRLRGFSNLFRKENLAWWGTRRWWINALLWTVLLCGLTAIVLFAPNEGVIQSAGAENPQEGEGIAFFLSQALSIFFEFGGAMLAIGTVILAQDLIIGERQNGLAEWLLSKPVTRRAYILVKVVANAPPLLFLLVGLPSTMLYAMLSFRVHALFPLVPFLSAVGMIALHTLFYLSLTLMLGTIFNSRGPILGIALGSILGGSILGGFIEPLFYVTPWLLPKVAWLTATGQAVSVDMAVSSLAATFLWSIVIILVALAKFEKTEF